jgi:prephenate dehydrogenase
MAGSEKKGAAFARADLFENRATVVTPTADTDPGAAEGVVEFWRSLGSRVVVMPPGDHDTAVAFVSHLPHAVAAALAGVVDPGFLPIAAGGFRDTTRIAAAAPAIWEPIFRTNRDAVLAAAEVFAARFDEFRRLLESGDGPGLVRWLSEGKRVRDAVGS